MLDQSDPKKEEGKKFISLIFSLDKFKAYQNQSLQIFDHESQILDEHDADEIDEEPSARRVAKGIHHNQGIEKALVKDFDLKHVHSLLETRCSDEAVEYIKKFKLTDLASLMGNQNLML